MTSAVIDEPGTADDYVLGAAAPDTDDPADVDHGDGETGPAAPPPGRRRPGPPPNPNSRRQQKLRRTTAAPKKRTTANRPAAPAPEPGQSASVRGAQTILGWVAQPLALVGMGMQLAAQAQPRTADGRPTRRARTMAKHGQALAADSLTIAVYGPTLAEGAAELADSGTLPWMAAALHKAAQVGPYEKFGTAAVTMLLQMACNHGLIPPLKIMGTMTLRELQLAAGVDPDAEGPATPGDAG